MFYIFIGVTFANLGREGVESGKTRHLICYRTKENNYYKTKYTDSSRASVSRQIRTWIMKQIIYDNT